MKAVSSAVGERGDRAVDTGVGAAGGTEQLSQAAAAAPRQERSGMTTRLPYW